MAANFRKAIATVVLLFAIGSVSACADIHPDNTPYSPHFKAYVGR